jgi:hypothetical protein
MASGSSTSVDDDTLLPVIHAERETGLTLIHHFHTEEAGCELRPGSNVLTLKANVA